MIKLSNINKFYHKNKHNEIHVLNNVDLTIDNVGFTTILGPSGSGKSTLLHVIGGLDSAKGSVKYDDLDFLKTSWLKKDHFRSTTIGYIFQNYNLIPELTVYENLVVQLDLIGLSDKQEINKRIDTCLEMVGMLKYKRRNVMALSGGQQQRIAIARALVKGSKIIIADEPTGNLDSKNSIEVMNILKILSKKCLVLLVTHNQDLASYYSDRIIRIQDGIIVDDNVNKNDNTLMHSEGNTIYLDEYNHEKFSGENSNIEVFSNSKINVRIIVLNNHIYVINEDGKELEVSGRDADLEILPTKLVKNQEAVENASLNFDFIPSVSTFKKTFILYMKRFLNAFIDFFFAKKKMWLVYFGLFMIGIIICFCFSVLNLNTTIDETYLKLEPDTVFVDLSNASSNDKFGYEIDRSEYAEILQSDSGVIGVTCKGPGPSVFTYNVVGSRDIKFLVGSVFFSTSKCMNKDIDLNKGEIAITEGMAQTILDMLGDGLGLSNSNSLIGKKISGNFAGITKEMVIKEIFAGDNHTIILSDADFFIDMYQKDQYVQDAIYRIKEENEVFTNLVLNTSYKDGTNAIYVSKKLQGYSFAEMNLSIRGYFDSDKEEVVFLTKDGYDRIFTQSFPKTILPLSCLDDNIEITGTLPKDELEILVNDLNKDELPIGSLFNNKYKVTGYFKAKYGYNDMNAYGTYNAALVFKTLKNAEYFSGIDGSTNCYFYSNDKVKTIDYFKNAGCEAYDNINYKYQDARNMRKNDSRDSIITTVTLIIVMIVFVFFINRSKMLHQIYNLGVYRALGASKPRLYRKFLIDAFVMTTFTTILGFSFMYVLIRKAGILIPQIVFNGGYFLLGLLGIYLVLIMASMLPIVLLFRKTPTEILAKYDI